MYAGSSGAVYNANAMHPGNGNGKWQGLVSTTNMRSSIIPYVRTRADSDNRNVVFCMNQLGGVGRKSNMFASTADGVKLPCQGSGSGSITLTELAKQLGVSIAPVSNNVVDIVPATGNKTQPSSTKKINYTDMTNFTTSQSIEHILSSLKLFVSLSANIQKVMEDNNISSAAFPMGYMNNKNDKNEQFYDDGGALNLSGEVELSLLAIGPNYLSDWKNQFPDSGSRGGFIFSNSDDPIFTVTNGIVSMSFSNADNLVSTDSVNSGDNNYMIIKGSRFSS